jgi:3-phosphoshikimate 1-carboxyvinyltransferase
VETDASGASYPLAAAAIVGGSVAVAGIRQDSLQGDTAFLGVLHEAGCTVRFTGGGVAVDAPGSPRGVDVDMNATPDVVPTLAAIALFAGAPTRIRNVGHLRYKESNRLEVLAAELATIGAAVVVHDDGLEIRPSPLHGGVLSPHDDHRLAMSFALIGLRTEGIVITQPECVRKSYPRFWEEYSRMTGRPPVFSEGA